MERRTFLTTGLAASALGLTGTALAMPEELLAAPRARRREGPIRLSSNENPLGISPKARSAIIEGIVDANRYPGGGRERLLEALAQKHGVGTEHVALGAGSTEVLKMAVDAVAGAGGTVIVADPTYEDTTWYSEMTDIPVLTVPLTNDQQHDIERMRAVAARAERPVVVYVCNPNNPTGTLTPSADIDAWIGEAPEDTYFLVDEAYFEYVDDPRYHSALRWVPDRPNVMVARTFSKIHGMAGIRLGYMLAHADTVERLRRRHVRNNANHFANVAALASLQDPDFVRRSLETNAASRRIAYRVLDELSLAYFATHTNFVMHAIRGNVETHIQRMLDEGLRVGRPFPPMTDWNRVSFGLPDEVERWAEALRMFRKRGWV